MRRGFTLLELLVVIGVMGLLAGLVAPALGRAGDSARAAACLSNLRQAAQACQMHADERRGAGPAIGWPYTRWPNWAIVVMDVAGERRTSASDPFENAGSEPVCSILVCPQSERSHAQTMTRTYAMNGAGHAGLPGDPDTYDAPSPALSSGATAEQRAARIRFNLVDQPSRAALIIDSAVAFFPSNAPPPTRTASVIDFRQPAHLLTRIGFVHAGRSAFNAAMLDGSAAAHTGAAEHWRAALP